MRLLASLQQENRWHELLADIEATEDTAQTWDDLHVRRRITGTVRRRGPIWDAFIPFWLKMASSGIAAVNPQLVPGELDGHRYFMVQLLQVDHDLYTSPAAINIEGLTILLALVELYDDPIENYRGQVEERNRHVEDLYQSFEHGQITVNDLRALRGRGPWPPPNGTRIIPSDQLPALRQAIFEDPMSTLARNFIH
jgi:hypothetical protein